MLAQDFAGIFFIVLFGGLFIFICTISAIKAVRDRRKIKKFIKAKEEATKAIRLQRQAYINMGQIEETPKHVNFLTATGNTVSSNYKATHVNGDSVDKNGGPSNAVQTKISQTSSKYGSTPDSIPHTLGNSPRNSVLSTDTSLCHFASMESLTDDVMNSINGRYGPPKDKCSSSDNPNLQHSRPQSSYSTSSANLTLPEDRVTATKTLRRYSYQVACAESSIDRKPPQFAKSAAIIKTYRSNNVAFENVAFNCDRNS
ncbi:uncharacterized protein LOC125649410 isoform X2 [Ostrea edulis]|nr:uncharacterized protein LOC125649410 isoform X2 [Ostrea edulis]